MSANRFGRAQKATALVPLALLSAAWTASLAGVGSATTSVSAPAPAVAEGLPDGTSVPTRAIEAPASVSAPDVVAPGLRGTDPAQVVSSASTSGIPAVALAAYQRAETVINAADTSCNVSWQLVAAIGRVESDHGRYGGNRLDDAGLAVPGIFGPALDGTKKTRAISDTDAGQFDSDAVWDRAVGPMQFIPSTWSVVGVDADGDGRRNPQDVDDAALASAVYLCSGADDLATEAGQRAAVHRYNNSDSYVDLVLSIAASYLAGEFAPVPNATTSAGYFLPDPQSNGPGTTAGAPSAKKPGASTKLREGTTGGGRVTQPEDDEGIAAAPAPVKPPKPAKPTQPQQPGNGGGAGDGAGDSGGGTVDKGGPGIPGAPTVTLPPLPGTGIPPVDQLLNQTQARAQCVLDGYVVLTPAFRACVERYTQP
ncbi:lytic transglycosylase domain-containing protein [Nocardioides pantholopis]|uniref:lytic transglycosylase domain-containing protein n=1 Tax=Nocardioides pantholopis TaxID=2483798 RepID=UPI000F0885C2|nr:lytic murein transglycosylase [Nocardioides pantholopis]